MVLNKMALRRGLEITSQNIRVRKLERELGECKGKNKKSGMVIVIKR